ncbi:MAG TPA: DNA-3-methyladenine glycosylase [Nocardioidaceae bacterium]|nr:DNA-3-methyladenine glycosylase [Nocardioidaceae bacterium]
MTSHLDADVRHSLGRPALTVAPEILGWRLSHTTDEGTVAVELTEVEAYEGVDDPASHAFRGRTGRNAVMFGPAGHLYCYFSYGMHWCANLVCGPEGVAAAVLLRAGRVVDGVDLARERRGGVADRDLARGPARLTMALGLGRSEGGADLLGAGPVRLHPVLGRRAVSQGPRVGVSRAAARPWRFWLTDDKTVSAYRRSPRADDNELA